MNASGKSYALRNQSLQFIPQANQFKNPDCRITLANRGPGNLLSEYADSYQGICTGDYPRFGRNFWEISQLLEGWIFHQSTVESTCSYSGRESILLWQDGRGELYNFLCERLGETGVGAWIRGLEAWEKSGVSINQVGGLSASLYVGDCFDNNIVVIIPKKQQDLNAIWAFCCSEVFFESVRQIDKKLYVTNKTMLKIPFDISYWASVANETISLPEPYSNDPTQWLFNGHPAGSTDPLQVAVARLLGYHWPQQQSNPLDMDADSDGIVCLPPVYGEAPAHERLRALLAAAYNQPPVLPDPAIYNLQSPDLPFTTLQQGWSLATQQRLLAAVGYAGKSLEEWLRDSFFEQHCRRFQNRPFIWHIWDGRKDGFAALVNYHKLDRALLDRLIYTYLGAWISAQRSAVERNESGADGRLVAALALQKQLELIRTGEPPYDIYVRWKPLHQQPIGWDPDLNDGVRLNSRPWVTAGVLRKKFTVNWGPDRGKNPDGSERINDLHFTRAEKEAARQAVASPIVPPV